MVRTNTFTSPLCGGQFGKQWNTNSKNTYDEFGDLAITYIQISWADSGQIQSFQVGYNDNTSSSKAGNPNVVQTTFTLKPSEFIVKIEGSIETNNRVKHLKFFTNEKKVYGPFGGTPTKNTFTLEGHTPGFGALWFDGYADDNSIISLRCTFAEFGITPRSQTPRYDIIKGVPQQLKYETSARSTFFKQLTSPVVTLEVGKIPTILTIHESLSGVIPFLRVLEHEGADKRKLKMPDDDPAIIVALLEFLATQSYTYASINNYLAPKHSPNPTDADPKAATITNNITNIYTTKPSDLKQGQFHLRLWSAASKYDCTEAAAVALQATRAIMETLNAGDCVLLWQEAYTYGLEIGDIGRDGMNTVTKRTRELAEVNPRMIYDLAEKTPALVSDLIRLLTEGGRGPL